MDSTYIRKPLIKDLKRLKSTLSDIPRETGCYLMKDNNDVILYIGKSKNLRERVKSYFRKQNDLSPRILLMVRQIVDIELMITDNESESLTLESNLIKKYKPYFNILLKDDKKYPYLCITWSEEYPRIFITRRRRNRNNSDKYYGPFVDVALLRQTLFNIKKLFPLRQRSIPLYKDRTCLNYSINRCPGVCQKMISSDDYMKTLKKIEMIFQGRNNKLQKLLTDYMNKLSREEKYEKAILVREQIKGIERLYESQKMIIPDSSICRDIIAFASEGNSIATQIFQMRSGKLVGRLGYSSSTNEDNINLSLQKIIEDHYSKVDPVEIPTEILVEVSLPNSNLIAEWLSDIKRKKVKIYKPERSKKAEMINLVKRNAHYELDQITKGNNRKLLCLEDLTELLQLDKTPIRIEGYDISHIQGSDAVGSQVVFINGTPAKHQYRKYIIKNKEIQTGHSDDYRSLSEVIKRRFYRWSKLKKEHKDLRKIISNKKSVLESSTIQDWPDLIMIDGGKGQLNSVINTLIELELEEDINVISLAKKNEEIFIPGLTVPLNTDKDQAGVVLLRNVRDEAHRFAVSFHRQRRNVRMIRSQLSEIPGVGSKRISSLLNHFKSIDAIQLANKDQLANVEGVGSSSADMIWNYFHPEQ